MAAFSRGISMSSVSHKALFTEQICSRCQFSTSATVFSGHNRWSKIRHDKGAKDLKKNAQRSIFSAEITMASKLWGPDPNMNSRLATILANAKKSGFPKASMEAAIARGQGVSVSGKALENLTLEAMSASNIAMVISIETDNKPKSLMDVRVHVKYHKGNVTPTSYLFKKRGRVQFEKDERALTADDVLEEAIEAGAEDVETDEDGNIVVWTEPSNTKTLAEALKTSMDLKAESSDILWDPNEDTLVPINDKEEAQSLMSLFDKLADDPTVTGVYTNAAQGILSDDEWADFQSKAAL